MMKVKNIVEKYLKDNGYDGLYNPNDYCTCELDDIMLCDDYINADCTAGYKGDCT